MFGISYDPGNGLWKDELKKLKKVDFLNFRNPTRLAYKSEKLLVSRCIKKKLRLEKRKLKAKFVTRIRVP